MVFKTVVVGSIPATLVLLSFFVNNNFFVFKNTVIAPLSPWFLMPVKLRETNRFSIKLNIESPLSNIFFFASFFFFHYKKKNFFFREKNNFNSGICLKGWGYEHFLFIRFLEWYLGKKVLINVFFFLQNKLPTMDYVQCVLWENRLIGFSWLPKKRFSIRRFFFLNLTALRLKDMNLLFFVWHDLFKRVDFWKHRLIIHFVRYVFVSFFSSVFSSCRVRGFRFFFKGKISVSGNSRKRSAMFWVGRTSFSKKTNRILSKFDIIPTWTGVMGLQLWLIF